MTIFLVPTDGSVFFNNLYKNNYDINIKITNLYLKKEYKDMALILFENQIQTFKTHTLLENVKLKISGEKKKKKLLYYVKVSFKRK